MKISGFLQEQYARIMKTIKKKRARMIGSPVGLYFKWNKVQMTTDMAAGIPVNKTVQGDGIESLKIEKSRALLIDYFGPYEKTADAHNTMNYYLYRTGLKINLPIIEEYLTDPKKEKDPAKWHTRIIYLVE